MRRVWSSRSFAIAMLSACCIGAGESVPLDARMAPARASGEHPLLLPAQTPDPPPERCREEEREDSGCESGRAVYEICPMPKPPRRLRCV